MYGVDSKIKKLRLYLSTTKAFERQPTLKVLGAEYGMSARSLTRHFGARVGQSPIEYMRNARHMIGKVLLEEGFNVREASEALKYKTPDGFYEAFKKAEGVTPREFQKFLRDFPRVIKAIKIMQGSPQSLERVSEMAGFKTYGIFRKAFVNIMGVNPSEFIADYHGTCRFRPFTKPDLPKAEQIEGVKEVQDDPILSMDVCMNSLKSMLGESEKSFADIASEAGFADEKSLTRYFSHYFHGITPGRYRLQVRSLLKLSLDY